MPKRAASVVVVVLDVVVGSNCRVETIQAQGSLQSQAGGQ